MVSDTPTLAEQGADEDFELADKMRGVSAVLVDGVEKLRFVASTWLACPSAERFGEERGRGEGEGELTPL